MNAGNACATRRCENRRAFVEDWAVRPSGESSGLLSRFMAHRSCGVIRRLPGAWAQSVVGRIAARVASVRRPILQFRRVYCSPFIIPVFRFAQGRESTQALMFHVMNKATGATGYKQTPADKYDVALEAIRHYVCTRKIKT